MSTTATWNCTAEEQCQAQLVLQMKQQCSIGDLKVVGSLSASLLRAGKLLYNEHMAFRI